MRLVKRREVNVSADEEAFKVKRVELQSRATAQESKNRESAHKAEQSAADQKTAEALIAELRQGLSSLENDVETATTQGQEIAQRLHSDKRKALERQAELRLELDDLNE